MGSRQYYAWYELYPNPPAILGPVSPGDQMEASIVRALPGTWDLSIADVSSGNSASGPLS